MTAYHVLEANQKDVLRYFLGGPSFAPTQEMLLTSEDVPEDVPDGGCLLLWRRELPNFPYALVAEPAVLKKLLPKLMALPGLASPVTCLFRAWTFDDLRAFNRRRPQEAGTVRAEAAVGLIVGELISRIGPQLDLHSVAASSARRTLAYALASMHLAGADEMEKAIGVRNWERAAEMTQTHVDGSLLSVIANLSRFAHALPKSVRVGDQLLAMRIRDWVSSGVAGNSILASVLEHVVDSVGEIRKLSREERFEVLGSLVQQIRRSERVKDGSVQLVIGYLLSLIEPGSLDFLPLSHEMETVLEAPGVTCSYAMCAALLSGKDFLMRGSGLGIHLLLAGLLQARAADVSFAELQIMDSAGALNDLHLRTAVPSVLEVELIPEITSPFFVGQRKSDSSASESRRAGAELDADQIGQLEQIAMGLEELGRIASRLRSSVQTPDHQAVAKGKRIYRKK